MKKSVFFLVPVVLLTVPAFRTDRAITPKTTTYGLCDCATDNGAKPTFSLTVREDHTFCYVNKMDPSRPVDISGSWHAEGRRIELTDYSADVKIHDKWKLEEKFPCITSRNGMEFSRLCAVKCD